MSEQEKKAVDFLKSPVGPDTIVTSSARIGAPVVSAGLQQTENLDSAGIAALLQQTIEKWRNDRAHTYSSENADLYRGFDNGRQRCADELESLLTALTGGGRRHDEQTNDDQSRVDGCPGSAHGDLPRRATGDKSA